jgi:dihydroxyacetone synthase
MGALQGLHQIRIATHDSIGTGEDGPTHKPIDLPALYRAMPNLLYIRPCDSEETAGDIIAALKATSTPTVISLLWQDLEQYPQYSSRDCAYTFLEEHQADVTLIGVGAEMSFSMRTREVLREHFNIKSRVVSFPCQRLFMQQTIKYNDKCCNTNPAFQEW